MSEVGTLWIVATPIGTLEDLGLRARQLLVEVDMILAEDTRRAHKLLSALDLKFRGTMRSLYDQNEASRLRLVISSLEHGLDVALLSDAGTPVLSDPGFQVVRRAREAGLPVRSVPGPSAFTAALAASAQPPLPATLVGFLPPRRGRRRKKLGELRLAPGSLVVFLSPHRIDAELEDLIEVLGATRPASLIAEISKRHERCEVGTLGTLRSSREASGPRGEYVLVVGPDTNESSAVSETSRDAVGAAYERAYAECGDRRQAYKLVAARLGMSKREVYSMLIEKQGE